MGANQIVEALKERNEDFEWYPTTQEIVDRLAGHIFKKRTYGHGEYECDYSSVLDIGCGNGSFFEKLDRTEPQKFNETSDYGKMLRTRYGIEKSFELCERLPGDVVIIGSDFHEQTLIDKKVDLIFCNPPHSDYLRICYAMIDVCEAVYMLKDWQTSKGARQELQYAADWRKEIIYQDKATIEPSFPIVYGHPIGA